MTGCKDNDDPTESIDGFKHVVQMEGEKGEW